MPEPLTWTDEKPTCRGWWWHRRDQNDLDARPRCVIPSRIGLRVQTGIDLFPLAQFGGQWSDKPIPEPEEKR